MIPVRRRSPFALCVLALFLGTGFAQELRTPEFLAETSAGFQHLYALDYPAARLAFSRLESKYPEHPAPPLYLASAVWLQELFGREELDLDKFIAPGYFTQETDRVMPESEQKLFQDGIARAQQHCDRILKKTPGHLEARYFQGAIYGIRAAYAMTVERRLNDAFKFGKQAYKTQLKVVEEDPGFADAYMSVGLYEYVVGSIPWYIKWLATIVGYRGSKERGLEYLGRAAVEGKFVADDSRVLQMVLFVREHRFEEALANISYLQEKHPANFLLHLNRAQVLEKLGKTRDAGDTLLDVEELAAAKVPNYQKLPLSSFRLQLADRLLSWKRLDEAKLVLERGLADPAVSKQQRSRMLLESGKIYDLLGQREAAVRSYREVLTLPDFKEAHSQARAGLDRPFRQ